MINDNDSQTAEDAIPLGLVLHSLSLLSRSQVEIEIKKRMKAEATQDHLVGIYKKLMS